MSAISVAPPLLPTELSGAYPGPLTEKELEALLPPQDLPSEDGQNMESEWHRSNIALLVNSIRFHFRDHDDVYAGGNSFIYFSTKQVKNEDYKGPDFFAVRGVPRDPIRQYWAVWDEDGRYPNVIVELLSPTTATNDLTHKKRLYEQTFRTPNYFCFDPATRELFGWSLQHEGSGQAVYHRLSLNEHGRLWCDELQLWVGPWKGEFSGYNDLWLRFFTPDGALVQVAEEYQFEQAERQRLRAEAEQQRAESEQQRADAEQQRADAERARAESAEAELTRLKALLSEKGVTP